jgi:hypothetical protein
MTAPIPPLGVDRLAAWLREHRGAYTDEALRGRLLEAGHAPADADAAFARLDAEDAGTSAPPSDAGPPAPPRPAGMPAPLSKHEMRRQRDGVLAFLAAIGAILGIPALLLAVGAGNLAVPVGLVALLLALVGWEIAREGGRPEVATGLGVAVAIVVVVPVVAVVAVFGICLVAGGRVV